jgi:(p)ppGpp synthase/HD superfamily hydrolase
MHYLKTEDEELMCIALGHDLIEDAGWTAKTFLDEGFSERVVAGIVALTKVKGESYEEYKAKVKANPDAVVVKMADLRHNTDIRRLKGITEKDLARVAKYHEFYLELMESL